MVASAFTPLQPGAFVAFTVMGTLVAILVFALQGRFARQPLVVFQRTAWIVLVVSWVPDILHYNRT